jgi:hypothetical protein
VAGHWRRLYNKEFHNLYTSPVITRVIKSRMMRQVRNVTHVGEVRNLYKILVGKAVGKVPCERPRCRCEENIRMDLREVCRKMWIGCI